MAHARRGGQRTRSTTGQPSRLTSWDLGPGGDDIATLDIQSLSSSTKVILGAGRAATERITIVRTYGFVELMLTTIAAALDGFSWAFGICVVSTDAFDAGAASIPSPFDDIIWPGWMVHRMGAIHSAANSLSDEASSKLIEFDSKAMRIQRLNEVAVAVIQVGETGTSVLQVRTASRQLLKLS